MVCIVRTFFFWIFHLFTFFWGECRFNPKAPRQLKVDLMHTMEHKSVVCCVKFSADGRFLAAGCNRATFIYDAVTSQRVA